MPDKVTPLWEVWRRWSDSLPEHIGPYTQGFTVRSLACADELESRMKQVRERVMALPTTTGDEEFYVPYVERDAVLEILREEGLLGDK